jgi:hypothetical protein
LISGYKADQNGKPYDLYYINLTNDQTTFLLPSYYKYGFNSLNAYKTEYQKKPDMKKVGISGWFDIMGNDVYFVWEGNLRIIKINIESRELTFFGEKTLHYIKPYVSKRLLEARRKRDSKTIRSEWAKMSYVRHIFTNSKYALVVYEGPNKQERKSNFRMQFCTLDGTFKEEVLIPDQTDYRMSYDKERNILYSLTSESSGDELEYFILKYKILEEKAK